MIVPLQHENYAAGAVVISGGGIIVIVTVTAPEQPGQPEQFLVTPL